MELHTDSHLDHSVPEHVVEALLARFASRDGFFIETVEVNEQIPCALIGPATGHPEVTEDQVHYGRRGQREYPSRLIDRTPSVVNTVTVIAGPHDGKDCVVYTIYGGPCAPKEPNDPTLTEDLREESEEFWSVHALASA